MRRRRVILFSLALILLAFAVVFFLSASAGPTLAGIARADWLLAGVVLAAVLAGLAALNDIWELVLKLFGRHSDAGGRDAAQERRNRRQLIQNVKVTWIQGVREQSLHQSVWIELGVAAVPDQVERPWPMTWQPDLNTQPQKTSKDILTIFREQAANALLILGAPGSGKTVTLLDLAQQLLDEAEAADDLTVPIPVVFNLSSWAQKRQALQAWLLEELDRTYGVPEKTAGRWLETDALVLLLDGLDEVAEAQREACAKAINAYRQSHSLTGMAVCSRSEEYQALAKEERLKLQGAVEMQPLTVARADAYLQKMGPKLWAVRELLREDKALQKWVQSPLFLYVVAMAYRGLSLEELRQEHNGSLSRLYDRYVTQMLQRHRPYQQSPYTPEQTRKWLAYLAGRLSERELTVYLIEQMQPDWLGKKLARRCLLIALKGSKGKIQIIDTNWSWPIALANLKLWLLRWMVLGLVIGLIFGLIGGRFAGLIFGLLVGLVFGLVTGLATGLIGGLLGGEVESHEKPNQGIWRALFVGLVTGLIYVPVLGVFSGLAFGMFFGVLGESDLGLILGLIFGLIFGLISMLFGGLVSFISHFSLRYLLTYYDYLPFQLVPFLEHTKDRLLLHRVGGGFKFIHRTLQDYFAAQDIGFDQAPD